MLRIEIDSIGLDQSPLLAKDRVRNVNFSDGLQSLVLILNSSFLIDPFLFLQKNALKGIFVRVLMHLYQFLYYICTISSKQNNYATFANRKLGIADA